MQSTTQWISQWISITISILALFTSIITHIRNSKQAERIKNINIKAKYFEAIFDNYLIHIIPEKRSYIRFNEQGHLDDFQPLIDALSEMRKSATYFSFQDSKFYDNLKQTIFELEDCLSYAGNHKYEKGEQDQVNCDIADKIGNIYSCINKYYLGL